MKGNLFLFFIILFLIVFLVFEVKVLQTLLFDQLLQICLGWAIVLQELGRLLRGTRLHFKQVIHVFSLESDISLESVVFLVLLQILVVNLLVLLAWCVLVAIAAQQTHGVHKGPVPLLRVV